MIFLFDKLTLLWNQYNNNLEPQFCYIKESYYALVKTETYTLLKQNSGKAHNIRWNIK